MYCILVQPQPCHLWQEKNWKLYFQGQTNHVRLLVYLSLVTSSCGKTHVILSGSALWDYKGERSFIIYNRKDPILSYFAPYSQYTFLYTFTCVLSFSPHSGELRIFQRRNVFYRLLRIYAQWLFEEYKNGWYDLAILYKCQTWEVSFLTNC